MHSSKGQQVPMNGLVSESEAQNSPDRIDYINDSFDQKHTNIGKPAENEHN